MWKTDFEESFLKEIKGKKKQKEASNYMLDNLIKNQKKYAKRSCIGKYLYSMLVFYAIYATFMAVLFLNPVVIFVSLFGLCLHLKNWYI